MGCCNKRWDGLAIRPARYWAGLVLFAGVAGAWAVLLGGGSLVSRRCRKVWPFYRAWAAERLGSLARREDIRIGPVEVCDLPGGGA